MHLLTKGRIVRIICDSNTDCSRTLYYNDAGLLACSEGTAANPLHGFIFLIHPNSGIIFDYEGIDALSKNLPSRITSQKHRYEFNFSGEQVSSGEKHLIADSSPIMRMTTDYSLDFEYLK